MNLLKVSLTCLHFSLMFSEGEVKSPYFLQVLLVDIPIQYSVKQCPVVVAILDFRSTEKMPRF
jgi:hypothetical protein